MQTRFGPNFRMHSKFLEEAMFKGMADPMSNTLIPSSYKRRRIEKRIIVMFGINSYSNKNSLPRFSLTTGQFALYTDKPVIAKTAKTILTLTTRNHEPLARHIPGAKRKRRTRNIRTKTRWVLLVVITTVSNPYGRQAGHN